MVHLEKRQRGGVIVHDARTDEGAQCDLGPCPAGLRIARLGFLGQFGVRTGYDDWIVFGGLSLLDSENRNPSNTAQNGSELNWTPEVSGNLWTTYRLPFGLVIGGGTQYTGSSRVSLANTSLAELPSHWIFNAMASYPVNDRLNVRLNVTNVTDELYARAINNNSNRTYLGDPRSFLLSLDYRF